ncbi:MAG TPA: DUF2520 domain-containing protein [Thermoanaerobaculia bacterium]|nr:DUF2520 domain-containing protein [Thermoanaerobaculia bacterium]
MSIPSADTLALVGPGRAGRALARAWKKAGGKLAWVLARRPEAASGLGADAVFGPDQPVLPPCDMLVLAVPDDAVEAVAVGLSGRARCRFAFHLAGALGSESLAPLRRSGASVASLHPVRPFTGADGENWVETLVAVEGDEPAAAAGSALATRLGARPYRLAAPDRALYHAAATLAAGGTAAIVSVAVRGWVHLGIPEDIARETLAGLAARAAGAVADRPFAEAFTGAVARRDAGTVRGHVAALAPHPESLALYRALAEETLRRTAGAGREDEIRRILESPDASERIPTSS